MTTPFGQTTDIRWIPFENTSGAEIPAYAVLRMTGSSMANGELVLSCAKPDTTQPRVYVINGPESVAASGSGRFGRCTFDAGWLALYDPSGSPAFDELWGPVDGQWHLKKGKPGFTILGGAVGTGANSRVAVAPAMVGYSLIRGQLVGAMATSDATWTVDNIEVLQGADPRSDTTSSSETVTFANNRASLGFDDQEVNLTWNALDSAWEVGRINPILRGTTASSHALDANGTINITGTSESVTAMNQYAALDSGKKCHIAVDEAAGSWYIIAANPCS